MLEVLHRTMQQEDWPEVAELIYLSTNAWYQTHGMSAIFQGGPDVAMVFCEEYEALDPGCCILAIHPTTDRIIGSCFYHPRSTHMSLGIMNVHPNYSGQGIARGLLQDIINAAEEKNLAVRLVSSALNLDSYALYTRAGFVPRSMYQDMYLPNLKNQHLADIPGFNRVRDAVMDDLPAIISLEMDLHHIHREKDYQHFISNTSGIWHLSVYENAEGNIEGFLASVNHPGSNMLGPGVMRTQDHALALIAFERRHHQDRTPVFLIPVTCRTLVSQLYALGARVCELHVHQVRGPYQPGNGILMPSFMPETC